MSQLVHWNPFKTLARFDPANGFDEFVRQFGLRPSLRDLDIAPDIRIDVSEDEQAYRVSADVPGVKKEDIEVSVHGREVSISASLQREAERKGETSVYSERSQGRAYRSFTLPQEVDSAKAEATYADGVLRLVLPKQPQGNGHRIAVG